MFSSGVLPIGRYFGFSVESCVIGGLKSGWCATFDLGLYPEVVYWVCPGSSSLSTR